MTGILRLVMLAFALLGLVLMLVAGAAWRGRRRISSLLGFLAGAVCLLIGALCGVITVGIRGYRALTQEVVAATIRTEPIGDAPQHFRATVTLPDGSTRMYTLAGDAVYVDAHVLKWRPIANLVGLSTAYELDRIGGRYQALRDEQERERTIYSLATAKPFDAFDLAHSWVLRPLVDAEYGSATFVGAGATGTPDVPERDARGGATYEVRVSTTGLLVRRVRPK